MVGGAHPTYFSCRVGTAHRKQGLVYERMAAVSS